MKSLMLLVLLFGAMVAAGCECKDVKYPQDTFIGSSGWPSGQVPIDKAGK